MNLVSWNMPWLLLLATQPFIILILRKYFEQRHLDSYVKKELQPWVVVHNTGTLRNKLLLRNIAYYLAWLLFAIAAAGPRIAEDTISGVNSSGKDIMIVLDISQSMHATDLSPSRLHQAHSKINHLINNTTGSRIGIIVYAAKPHLYVPLTYDKEALSFYLKNLKFLVPPSQGSQPLSAIKLASKYLDDTALPNNERSKSILLITDTDTTDVENERLNNSLEILSKNNIPIFTLLMASNNGEAIPGFSDGWINIDGRPVISRPKPESYQFLSDKSNGALEKPRADNAGIDSIINNIESLSTSQDLITNKTNWNELFYLFLFPAIIFIFINMFPYRLRIKKASLKIASANIFIVIISTTLLSGISPNIKASEQDKLRTAYHALLKEDHIKSRELYSSINGFEGRFGEAISSYRLSDYPRAIRLFEQAVVLANSNHDFARSLYNLGNSYFQTGNYPLALSSYKSALLYQPQHAASAQNMAYTEKALLAVEERKKILAITSRAGRGPRTARAEDDVVFTKNNNVSIDNSESENTDTKKTNANQELNIPKFIILRGLEFAEKSDETNQQLISSTTSSNINRITTVQLNKLLDKQSLLWRRIFEIEEGYPAPLDQPDTLPGVQPW